MTSTFLFREGPTLPGGHHGQGETAEAFPFLTSENHGRPADDGKPTEQPTAEEALDSGVEESFPASDLVSVTVTKVKLSLA